MKAGRFTNVFLAMLVMEFFSKFLIKADKQVNWEICISAVARDCEV